VNRDFSAIPVIDIGGLFANDPNARVAVAAEMEAAARSVGFFYVTGHGVPMAARERLESAAGRFFSLPMARKMEVYIGLSENHSGYVPEGEEVFSSGKIDRKEAFDVGLDYAGPPRGGMLGPNLWPDLEGFKADVGHYYAHVQALARVLFRGFALALGQPEDFFDERLSAPPAQLRLIHYPYDPHAVDAEGIGAHTDYECFTILYSTAPGLEVMNGAGQWIDAPPLEGGFVINIGDMIEALSNGDFIATSHRVRKVTAERYSFPFFAACDYETAVEPLARFVTADQPSRYPRIISGEHLFAQTAQTFAYLKRRIADGAVALPQGAKALESFGQQARARSTVR
jgi:isopenicillin N synthase-like dioxygenase